MKRFLPYILIVLIFVQLLAPFTLGSGVKINKAEASDAISMSAEVEKNDTTLTIYAVATFQNTGALAIRYSAEKVGVVLMEGTTQSDGSRKIIGKKEMVKYSFDDAAVLGKMRNSNNDDIFKISFTGLKPETTYALNVYASHDFKGWWAALNNDLYVIVAVGTGGLISNWTIPSIGIIPAEETGTTIAEPNPLLITTAKSGETDFIAGGQQTTMNDDALLPVCSAEFWTTIGGCFGHLLYWAVFQPTSFIFGLTGKLLDVSVDYSVRDTSYRSDFVVEGWGVVRDFCNMFFIFIMLYIAFGTILKLHGVNPREMIIKVVIIGLLMNFSLFASQIIIDTSNILTRVFYNSNSIKVGPMVEGVIQDERGSQGEIKLSEALVAKINPQKLLLQAQKVGGIQTKTPVQGGESSTGINAKTFILVTVLASIVNIVGIITFLISSLIFIARVIGLWMAMIFAPLAFLSYTVPAMQDWEMVGWKKWWPETMKLAFMAPVFVFFIYLIIKFLQTGLGLAITDDATGMNFILGIFVPFIFIMVLLWKSKDIAKSMSGKIGQSITNSIAAVGGLALGGAALGAAAVGRSTIGAFMKGASTGDTAAQRLRDNDPNLSAFGRVRGKLQQISGYEALQKKIGAGLNKQQHEITHATHARSELDTVAGVVAHGKKWDELNGEERYEARRKLARDRWVRDNSQAQGFGTRKWDALSGAERGIVDAAVGVDAHGAAIAGGLLDTHTTWDDEHTIRDSRRKVKLHESLIQSTVGGSFDVRNLSSLVASEQDKGFNKFATGLTSTLASGMRGAFKQSNINYGTGQKDFVKDLGHTISEALKSATIKVDLSHVGEETKEGHGGGHGGGGHH